MSTQPLEYGQLVLYRSSRAGLWLCRVNNLYDAPGNAIAPDRGNWCRVEVLNYRFTDGGDQFFTLPADKLIPCSKEEAVLHMLAD